MVVVKFNGSVYIALSCWSMRDPEARRTGSPDLENVGVWHPKNLRQRLIATSSAGRFTDIIRYENVFPTVFNQRHLILESFDKMFSFAKRFGLCEDNRLPVRTVFAEKDRAFVINGDGSHIEIEDVYCFTCDDEAVMALYDLKGVIDPYEFIKMAFSAIEDVRKYVMFPVTVMHTGSNDVKIINR